MIVVEISEFGMEVGKEFWKQVQKEHWIDADWMFTPNTEGIIENHDFVFETQENGKVQNRHLIVDDSEESLYKSFKDPYIDKRRCILVDDKNNDLLK